MKAYGIITALLLTIAITGCASTDAYSDSTTNPAKPSSGTQSDGTIAIAVKIPYAPGNRIAGNIKRECRLPEKLSYYINAYARDYRIPVVQKQTVSAKDPGLVLLVEITDSVSAGNAFFGHSKYTQIAGRLFQDGKAIGSFQAARNSAGGAFAEFKSSCAVLGRTVKALGRDVASWLRSPEMDSTLGDM